MTIKQTFIAFDGKEFETEKECAKYEAANELVNIMPIFKKVEYTTLLSGCRWYNTDS